jgi:hypothetical protein
MAVGPTPLIFMGSLDGARRALDWIAAFAPEWVIPGHGPVVAAPDLPSVLDAHQRYYRLVADTARTGLRDGLSPLEAAGCDLGSFAALPDAERIVLNLHRAYSDIGGHAFDLDRAFIDAMAYKPRAPARGCLAFRRQNDQECEKWRARGVGTIGGPLARHRGSRSATSG